MSQSDKAVLVIAEAVGKAVGVLAPDEQPYLSHYAAAWERGELVERARSRRPIAGAVGFGLDLVSITEIVYAVIGGAASEVLGAAVTERWQRRRGPRGQAHQVQSQGGRWWQGARRGASRGAVGSQPTQLALRAGDADLLRDACRRHALAVGLTQAQADLLADAVLGAIYQQPDQL